MATTGRLNGPLWVAIGNRAGMGKDTLGSALCDILLDRGLKVCIAKFATAPKLLATQLWHDKGIRSPGYYEDNRESRNAPLPLLGDQTWRDIMERLANSMRDIDPNVWVDALLGDRFYEDFDVVLVTDLRFPNEANAVHARGGICIHLVRQGVAHRDSHSENVLCPLVDAENQQYYDHGVTLPMHSLKRMEDYAAAFADIVEKRLRGGPEREDGDAF